MTIQTEINGTQIIFYLDGWLDTLSSPALGDAVGAVQSATEIVLDFDRVEYIASAGLRQIVACHRKAKELGATLSLIRVGNEVMNIFRLTGLDKKLQITEK